MCCVGVVGGRFGVGVGVWVGRCVRMRQQERVRGVLARVGA